jgi:CMP-N-acetylneuraminic acid synthetase
MSSRRAVGPSSRRTGRGAIAIILARAGSKGVPGKNWRRIAGRACVSWTIDAARDAATVERIIVSTDAPRVARIARRAGCEVVARPPELADDRATVDAAARHAIESIERASGRLLAPRTPIVLLYANVPVRPEGLIDRAVAMLRRRSQNADSVQSYHPVGKNHPWWTARLQPDGTIAPWEGLVLNHNTYRRQDLPHAYIPDGGVLVVTRRSLFLQVPGARPGPHAFFGLKRLGVINPEGSVVDIDEETDVLVASAKLRAAARQKRPERKTPKNRKDRPRAHR